MMLLQAMNARQAMLPGPPGLQGLPCICGLNMRHSLYPEDEVQSDTCGDWRHRVCMGVDDDEGHFNPATQQSNWHCEACRPQRHLITLTALATGRPLIWQYRQERADDLQHRELLIEMATAPQVPWAPRFARYEGPATPRKRAAAVRQTVKEGMEVLLNMIANRDENERFFRVVALDFVHERWDSVLERVLLMAHWVSFSDRSALVLRATLRKSFAIGIVFPREAVLSVGPTDGSVDEDSDVIDGGSGAVGQPWNGANGLLVLFILGCMGYIALYGS
ncbi:hypothetical protein BAUCODRAFT_521221 [Baudoinia panamericana UAMH 10762]|uniref:Zinc finger PHD-type domain-containing protein n=1 Tax=Baudoinia panamericana (strain UAMH 10762) TaxID=717646 RepID=M2MTX5_BAUPA|nr:uncharacterized protein BAUCODRAFT_521221 [Baudoinia panamericana UAMH 10762]EMC94988.1 hypothetical protein BAUCODRAFT_521221 [Baudoinia panamericana UAMH 10762]